MDFLERRKRTEWPCDGSSNLEVRQDYTVVYLGCPEQTEICGHFLMFSNPIIIFSFQLSLQLHCILAIDLPVFSFPSTSLSWGQNIHQEVSNPPLDI